MKRSLCCITLLMLGLLAWVPVSLARSFETGWLKDEKGSIDPETKSVVRVVTNMGGRRANGGPIVWDTRFVSIQIPIVGVDPNKIIVLGTDGKPIPHKDPKGVATNIDQVGTMGTVLFLNLKYQEGFSFRLKYDD